MPVRVNDDSCYIQLFCEEEGRRRRRSTSMMTNQVILAKVTYNEIDDEASMRTTHVNNPYNGDAPGDKAVQVKMHTAKIYNVNELYRAILHKLKLMHQPARLHVHYSYVEDSTNELRWTKVYTPRIWEAGCRRHRGFGRGLKPWIAPIPCAYCSTECDRIRECQHGHMAPCFEAMQRRMRAPLSPPRQRAPLSHRGGLNGRQVNGNPSERQRAAARQRPHDVQGIPVVNGRQINGRDAVELLGMIENPD